MTKIFKRKNIIICVDYLTYPTVFMVTKAHQNPSKAPLLDEIQEETALNYGMNPAINTKIGPLSRELN